MRVMSSKGKMSNPNSHIVVLTKLVLYLSYLLWQFRSELKFQATAYSLLPDDEVSSLTSVINKLGLKPAPTIEKTYCQNSVSGYGITIGCDDCTTNDNQGNPTCHIKTISTNNVGLTTVIPEEIGGLPYLSSLDLSNNKLHGPIPAILGDLSNLETLDLSKNRLNGSIPQTLGRLQNLRWLYLQYNLLDGTIPRSLGSLRNLRELYLQFNRLSGSIPDELGNLVNLTKLSLSENILSGPLPDKLGNLSLLSSFWATANFLSYTFPKSYGRLRSLKDFSISGNYISGPLPVDIITRWKNIETLSLLGNNFKGNLTEEVFNLPNLQHLVISDLGNAGFKLPSKINNTKFVSLILRNCSITGSIPKYIGNQMPSLKYLDLSFNNLTGGLPGYMNSGLHYMSFSTNMLNGTIPAWILQAVQTRRDLSFNNFTALDHGVPSNPDLNLFACCRDSSATEPEMMDPLDMMNTYCPEKEQKQHSLFINCGGGETIVNGNVYEQDNDTSRFYTSPRKNWGYSSSGDFFVENVNSSDYTKNMACDFSVGEAALYNRVRLSPVSLKYYAFCLRPGTYTVTLKFAEIVYTQDTDYTSLQKRAFDVYIQDDRVKKLSNFNIRDEAGGPERAIAKNFTAVVNSNSLLMIHMYWDGKGSIENAPAFNGPLISAISVTPDFKIHDGNLSLRTAWISGLGSGLGVLLLLIGASWAHKAIKKRKIIQRRELFFKRNGGLLLEQQISSGKVNVEKIKLFNSNELEKSTDNFNIDRVLGQGGQGTVFKGMLADGNIVAVKKSKIEDKGKVSEFINEVIILSQINHRNIVRLLGCCLETEVPLLVYEFIPNGTLSQYIYEQNEEFPLTWKMRLQIATEIAGALYYLHAAASCPIYHRDIKSTNILLDEKYRAKIADFGTSRSVAIDQTHLTTNVHGTFGYLDPEYFQSSQFTEKSDVYSFGVVLVELLTGKKPISSVTRSTEEEEEEYRSLAAYFLVSMQEDRLFNILDSLVVKEGSKEDIMIVSNLARRCLSLNGVNRPTMREVTTELEAIQLSNRTHQGAELFIPEYPIEHCDDVVSSATGSTWDSGPTTSLLPQSSRWTM